MIQDPSTAERSEASASRQTALAMVLDAFAEAMIDGLPEDSMTQAALFVALQKLVASYGEDAVATFAERLPERVRHGEFTIGLRQ